MITWPEFAQGWAHHLQPNQLRPHIVPTTDPFVSDWRHLISHNVDWPRSANVDQIASMQIRNMIAVPIAQVVMPLQTDYVITKRNIIQQMDTNMRKHVALDGNVRTMIGNMAHLHQEKVWKTEWVQENDRMQQDIKALRDEVAFLRKEVFNAGITIRQLEQRDQDLRVRLPFQYSDPGGLVFVKERILSAQSWKEGSVRLSHLQSPTPSVA